jgi:hypothetical protein
VFQKEKLLQISRCCIYGFAERKERENILKETQKICDENVKINEKQRELHAKCEKLRRLDVKVGFLNSIYSVAKQGMLYCIFVQL